MLSAVVETAIYAASWKVLAGGTFQLLATPQLVIDAATEVIRTVPLTRGEFAEFESRLFNGPSAEGRA